MTDVLLDLIFVVCVALVAVGAGLIFMPAGLIVGGLFGAAGSLYYARGGAGDRSPDSPGA